MKNKFGFILVKPQIGENIGASARSLKNFGFSKLNEKYYESLSVASKWLYYLTDPISGDCPNIGANDGAKLFNLGNDFRDFTNSVQLSNTLYNNSSAFKNLESNLYNKILKVEVPEFNLSNDSSPINDLDGFLVANQDDSKIIFRYPHGKFRPSQADFFHLDLWIEGINFLKDLGTYSYDQEKEQGKFSSVTAHNTLQFGESDQMYKFSRFLYLGWPQLKNKEIRTNDDEINLYFEMQDFIGRVHKRTISFKKKHLRVIDEYESYDGDINIRWHLPNMKWIFERNTLSSNTTDFKISVLGKDLVLRLNSKDSSKYYGRKESTSELIIKNKTQQPVITEFNW